MEHGKPYRDAGFIVLMPALRGENGQFGSYSMFYNEVEDVLAAAEYLAKQPAVDATRIYIAGHSVGGTLVLLSAMTSDRFRAAASFSGAPDSMAWSKGQPEVIPFDQNEQKEFEMRSPLAYATSFKCPARLILRGPGSMVQRSQSAHGNSGKGKEAGCRSRSASRRSL